MCEIYCAEVEKLALLLYQEIKIETMCFGFSSHPRPLWSSYLHVRIEAGAMSCTSKN
jgi:hypothetical protein